MLAESMRPEHEGVTILSLQNYAKELNNYSQELIVSVNSRAQLS